MLPMLLLLADVDAIVARARQLTAPERRCEPGAAADITVCGRRAADRFRVPFSGYEAGDRRAETVSAERLRLQHKTDNCEERRAIMVSCGFWGLGVGTGGGGTHLGPRTLAP